MQLPRIRRSRVDQCQYGAQAPHGRLKSSPVMKPTGFMSNSLEMLQALSKRCTSSRASAFDSTASAVPWCSRKQDGKHAPCAGNICREMAKYSHELCRAAIRGVTAQSRADGRSQRGCCGIQMLDHDPDVRLLACGPMQGCSGKYKDALTGHVLKDDLLVRRGKWRLDSSKVKEFERR